MSDRYVLHTDYATELFNSPMFISVYRYGHKNILGSHEPGEVGVFGGAEGPKVFLHQDAPRDFTVEDLAAEVEASIPSEVDRILLG